MKLCDDLFKRAIFVYVNWTPNEPNESGVACLLMNGTYGWQDDLCDTSHLFACEKNTFGKFLSTYSIPVQYPMILIY